MWTRNKHRDGNFSYSVWNDRGVLVEQIGGFTDPLECDKAAEKAHRRILFGVDNVDNMSDDELLAALEA